MAYDIARPSKTILELYTICTLWNEHCCSDHTLIAVEVKEGQETKMLIPLIGMLTLPHGVGQLTQPLNGIN